MDQITDVVIADFELWRKVQIKTRKNAGKNGERAKFDLVVLRAAFNFEGRKKVVRRKAWLTSGFSIPENPVPATDKKNKPGAHPEDPTQPFSDDELDLLRAVSCTPAFGGAMLLRCLGRM